jgi:type IV secretory pathway VirB3-like protein
MIVPAGAFDRLLLLVAGFVIVLTPIALVLMVILYAVIRRLDRNDPLAAATTLALPRRVV